MAALASLVVACSCFANLPLWATDAATYVADINTILQQQNPVTGTVKPYALVAVTGTYQAATALKVQAAIEAAIKTGTKGYTTADAGPMVAAVLDAVAQNPTTLSTLNIGTIAKGGLLGLVGKASTNPDDYVGLVDAVVAKAKTNPTGLASDSYTIEKNIVVAAAKASMIAGQIAPPATLVAAPSLNGASALAQYVVTQTFDANATANAAQKVSLLKELLGAVPAATVGTNLTYPQATREAAIASMFSVVTNPAKGNQSPAAAGALAGQMSAAGVLDANLKPVITGLASSLGNISEKAALVAAAASQSKSGSPLSDLTKNAIALAGAKAAQNAAEQGDIVAAVAGTMLPTDAANTALFPLDVRRAKVALDVIKLDYTNAPAIVEEMLKQSPIADPGSAYNGSGIITVAGKFATTLLSAFPVGVTVNAAVKADAIRKTTVSVNDQWDNRDAYLPYKVGVAQAVMLSNISLMQSIATSVADEVFKNSGWTNAPTGEALNVAKANFVAKLATGLSDLNKGVVASGAALADSSLAGHIVYAVGLVNPVVGSVTPKSKSDIATAVAKAFKSDVNLDNILKDIAAVGGADGTPAEKAEYASRLINNLALVTSGLTPGRNTWSPISNALATSIYSSSSADALTFMGSLAGFQKLKGDRLEAMVTSVAPIFGGDAMPELAGSMVASAPSAAVYISRAASNYAAANATNGASTVISVVSRIAGTKGVSSLNAVAIFNDAADAAAGTVAGADDKATQVGLVLKAILDAHTPTALDLVGPQQYQLKAADLAKAAGAKSYLTDAGKATVANYIAQSLVGVTLGLNAVNVANNLATSVDLVQSKADIAAAVIAAQNSTAKAVVQKLVDQLVPAVSGTDKVSMTLGQKQALVARIITLQDTTDTGLGITATVAGALASKSGIAATSAPAIASGLATGFSETVQRSVALGVARAVVSQASAVGAAVLNTTVNALPTFANALPANRNWTDPTTRVSVIAQVGARYAYAFSKDSSLLVKNASPVIAGAAATAAASGLAANQMSDVAFIFGNAFAADGLASATTIASSNGGVIAGNLGTLAAANNFAGLTNGSKSEEFAAIAVALVDKIPNGNTSEMAAVIKALAKISPGAAPDVLGVVLTNLIGRQVIGGSENPSAATSSIVLALKTAATAGTNAIALGNVINDIYDLKDTKGVLKSGKTGNPYTLAGNKNGQDLTAGAITGEETPVYNY